MKIEEQVLTIKQMQHLKELGLKVEDTAFSWCEVYEDVFGKKIENPPCTLLIKPSVVTILPGWRTLPTLTLQEILDMLPEVIWVGDDDYKVNTIGKHYICYYSCSAVNKILQDAWKMRIIDAAYNLLCWVLENGYLKKED